MSELFWTHVDKTDTCWLWTGTLWAKGYGLFRHGGRSVAAHRFSWFLKNGRYPDPGIHLHHTCEVRRCVNPVHLVTLTRAQHGFVTRLMQPVPETFRCGHPRTPENWRVRSDGFKECAICARAKFRRWYHSKKGNAYYVRTRGRAA